MTDEHDAEETAGPTPDPEQDAQIRALLAELGSGPDGEEMPPEVAARLEDTLALLVAERGREEESAEETTGNVVPMRRRWLPRLAGAAAAVIVLGAGGVAAANLGLLGTSTPMSDQGASSGGSNAESAPDSSAQSSSGDTSEGLITGAAASLPKLSAATFAADAEQLLQARGSLSTSPDSAPKDMGAKQRKADARVLGTCPGPTTTDGAVPRPVRYDGRLAVLVVHPERGGHQLVEAWDCAGNNRLAHTSLTP